MKKNLILIFINILLLIMFFCFLEIYSYKSIFVDFTRLFPDYQKFKKVEKEFLIDNHLYTNYEKPNKLNQLAFENDGRSLVGKEYKSKKPILLLGCSYTYGLGLKKEDTFGYQLSQYTKRTVYNWGWKTEGPDYSLLELKNKNNKKLLTANPPEYVIYTYMYDHPRRLVETHRQYRWYYLRKYGLLDGQKYSVLDNSYFYLALKNKMFEQKLYTGDYQENLLNYIFLIIKEMKKEVSLDFPESKFVVFLYLDSPEMVKMEGKPMTDLERNILYSEKWSNLSKDGIFVVTTKDLLKRPINEQNDILKNDHTATVHPTPKMWKDITPEFAAKFSLEFF